MGPVNLRADMEAEELEAQLKRMNAERDDLTAAISKLRQGISQLNREARDRLASAFEEVNKHFTELFTRLFGGGKAHLKLIDSDDPLDAGPLVKGLVNGVASDRGCAGRVGRVCRVVTDHGLGLKRACGDRHGGDQGDVLYFHGIDPGG